jgi:hypothetical protein
MEKFRYQMMAIRQSDDMATAWKHVPETKPADSGAIAIVAENAGDLSFFSTGLCHSCPASEKPALENPRMREVGVIETTRHNQTTFVGGIICKPTPGKNRLCEASARIDITHEPEVEPPEWP